MRDEGNIGETKGMQPGIDIGKMIDKTICNMRLPGLPHANVIHRKTASVWFEMRDDIAPQIRRGGIAVEEHDGITGTRLQIVHLGVLHINHL
jgi:hypothetical protein